MEERLRKRLECLPEIKEIMDTHPAIAIFEDGFICEGGTIMSRVKVEILLAATVLIPVHNKYDKSWIVEPLPHYDAL